MDEKIHKMFVEYDKLENEYPNIIKLNKTILESHIKKMNESLKKCEMALEEIKKIQKDLTKEEMITLYIYNKFMNQWAQEEERLT